MGLNHTPESKVMAIWVCQELSCSISSYSIYYWPEWMFESKVMAVWIFHGLPCLISSVSTNYAPESGIRVRIYNHLNFTRVSVVHFWASRYMMSLNHTLESKVMVVRVCSELSCSISSFSIYYWPKSEIRVQNYARLNLPCASMFNFEHLGILCAWITHPSEKLWPFEFFESFPFSFSCVSI